MAASIRHGAAEDWDGFRAAFGSVAAEGRWIGGELPIDWDRLRPSFEERCTDPRWLTLLAEADGEIVGWAQAEHHGNGKVSLGMGIVDGRRSAGLGSRLLEGILDWAREVGGFKVCLELWAHNTRALALYEKFGFVVEGRHPRHWRRNDGSLWDSLSMGLVLDHDAPGGPEQ
jgi:RimJ/RimL family protein N-acetyltransferase